jgi:Ca2+-binding RTX toxin-like protein
MTSTPPPWASSLRRERHGGGDDDGVPGERCAVAVDGVAGTEEDTTVLIDVLANDTLGLPNESDENVALLGLGSADPGSVASTGNGADTRVRYVPDAANSGTDDFTYDVCQETEGEPGERCDTATVTITVLPADEPNPPSEPECTARGTKGADKTRGTPKRDVICGFRGDDTIYGMGSNDVIVGNSGSDTIQGGAGDNLTQQ